MVEISTQVVEWSYPSTEGFVPNSRSSIPHGENWPFNKSYNTCFSASLKPASESFCADGKSESGIGSFSPGCGNFDFMTSEVGLL